MEEEKQPTEQKPSLRSSIEHIFESAGAWLSDLFNIHRGLDWIGTVTNIRKKVPLQGENMWMLICSVMIASVGLNMNSGAVIIGAMLISPLMSQILGIGLGIGINDRSLVEQSVKNFSVATITAILISFIYFRFITPINEAGSEIVSRTQPTILDALVAIFGGVAGIVAVSRKEQGAAIPGVAIATALVPPLAVSGYGLANGIWHYFTNAFYLFFLNSMLIAFATTLIVRYLGFPLKEFQSEKNRKRATIGIAVFIIALLIPGALILRKVLRDIDRSEQVERFFHQHFDEGTNQMYGQASLDNDIQSDTLIYKVSYRGEELDSLSLANYEQELSLINGKPTEIDATLLNLSKEQLDKLNTRKAQIDKTLEEKNEQELIYQNELTSLQNEIDSLTRMTKEFNSIQSEVQALWPSIEEISYAELNTRNFSDSSATVNPIVIVEWGRLSNSEKRKQKEQLQRYLQSKANLKNVEVIDQ